MLLSSQFFYLYASPSSLSSGPFHQCTNICYFIQLKKGGGLLSKIPAHQLLPQFSVSSVAKFPSEGLSTLTVYNVSPSISYLAIPTRFLPCHFSKPIFLTVINNSILSILIVWGLSASYDVAIHYSHILSLNVFFTELLR
jgi:hypothetical protein